MSRFNNQKMLPGMLAERIPPPAESSVPEVLRPAIAVPEPKRTFSGISEAQPNLGQSLSFYIVCTYVLSGYANDFAYHYGHNKAYISTVTVVLLPIFYLLTGALLRGLKAPSGRWWLAFAIWLVLAVPFSVWRFGSATMLAGYIPKNYLLFFFITASVVNVRQCRRFMYVLGGGAFLVLLACFAFGYTDNGRFAIPDSIFFSNPNELGLQLALNIMVLLFPFFGGNLFTKIAAAAGIALSTLFLMKTGSRGVLIALLGTCLIAFLLSRHKGRILALAIPLFAVVLAVIPADTRHRLVFIFAKPETAQLNSEADLSAVASQLQREQMLKTSIVNAFSHPLFGVGPGEFPVAVAGDAQKTGEHVEWLGTHNTYSQIASEAGLPGFVFYVATLLICLRTNYRLYRRTAGRKGLEDVAGLTYCLLLCIAAFALSTFFFHIAYSYYLPMLAGASAAIYLCAQSHLQKHAESRAFS